MSLNLGFDLEKALSQHDVSRNVFAEIRKAKIPVMPETITDEQLLLFYNACDKDLKGTLETIRLYYSHKRSALEHCANRDPESAHIQQCLKNQIYFYLPHTPKGHAVIYHRLANSKPSNYIFDEAIKTYFMAIDSCLYTQGPNKGVIFLFDMKNVNLGHLTRIRIGAIKKFFHFVQECVPCKLAEIHILNTVGFFDKVLALIKPFMKAEILEKLFLHTSTNDYDKLLKDVIPLSCLPSDFGGDQPSVDEMHERHCKELLRMQQYFIDEEKQWNTSPSPAKSKVIENTRQSFSKLEID